MSLKADLESALRAAVPVTAEDARSIAEEILPGKEFKQFVEWFERNGTVFLERING